jgi:hypothetical protein
MLTTEQILQRISRNTKKHSERNKRNYYRLGRRIEKLKERVNIHPEQKVSARRTYRYYKINKGIWDGPSPREFGKMNKDTFNRLLKGREEIEGETLLTAESSATQRRRRSTAQRKRRSKSTAQPQDAEGVPRNRRTPGLDIPIEGDSLSMEDFGMDLSIIEGYPVEQQTQGLSSLSSQPVDEVIVPTADCRPLTADRRSSSAERRYLNLEENQSGETFQDWLDDLFGAADSL